MCAPDSSSTVHGTTTTKSSSSSSAASFAAQTISMSAGRLVATLVAVAVAVFCATAQFYAGQPVALDVTTTETASSSSFVTVPRRSLFDHSPTSPNQTSRTVVVKSSSGRPTSNDVGTTRRNGKDGTSSTLTNADGSLNVGNVASEVGVVLALQAIFPVINRVILIAKRIRWASLGVRVSPAIGRALKTTGDVWHTLMLAYKKTALSKIVTRAKKMVKIFKHQDDDHDHEHHDHEDDQEDHHHHN